MIVMMIYPWTLMRFFWKLPSWILYSTVGEIAAIFAYMVVVNLVESILVLLVPVLMSIFLPQKWFFDRFETRGISLALFGLGYLMYLNQNLQAESPFPLPMIKWIPVALVAIIVLVFLVDRIDIFRKALREIANRFAIFLYISIPISIISLVVVLIRNVI